MTVTLKQLFNPRGFILGALICAVASCGIYGCTTPPAGSAPVSAAQQAIEATTTSYKALDLAIVSATSAVQSGALKGQDATNAYQGMVKAKAALDVALVALRSAQAAANASAAASAPSAPGTVLPQSKVNGAVK